MDTLFKRIKRAWASRKYIEAQMYAGEDLKTALRKARKKFKLTKPPKIIKWIEDKIL